MIVFKKIFFLVVCALFAAACFSGSASAQSRDRVVKSTSSQPTNLPPVVVVTQPGRSTSRPTLTNDVVVVRRDPAFEPSLVKKTGSSNATHAGAAFAANRTAYGSNASVRLDRAIKSRYGLPYHYGSTGPYSYDCSGFVWAAFQEAGINFTRTSAHSLWNQSVPVEGDERFKFGTLVFLNGLGHIGIVADEKGFYHASSSKGITYSPFEGYWANRIVGFRRLIPETPVAQ